MNTERAIREFQKKVLQLLIEIRDSVKIVIGSTDGTPLQIKPATTRTEFQELESCLKYANESATLRAHLKRLGGVDDVDMVKKSMAVTLSNAMMAQMSLKGKCGKLPFSQSLLCQIICDAACTTLSTTQTKVMATISKYLKYAPERMGGGGCKKNSDP